MIRPVVCGVGAAVLGLVHLLGAVEVRPAPASGPALKADSFLILSPSNPTLLKGSSRAFRVILELGGKPLDVTGYVRRWTSSQPRVASVDRNGEVSALQTGDTRIGDICYRMTVASGGISVPEQAKQDAKKVVRPVPRGTVMKLENVFFNDAGLVLGLWDRGQSLVREWVKGNGASSAEIESFCMLLQFDLSSPSGPRLDGADAPAVLQTLEAVIKPFSSEAAAEELLVHLLVRRPGSVGRPNKVPPQRRRMAASFFFHPAP